MDNKWVAAYVGNTKRGESQHVFTDGWVQYMRELEDTRDIMSDLVRPSWGSTGRFEILLIPQGRRHSSDADFRCECDKAWANRIVLNIQKGHIQSLKQLKEALRAEGKKQGTYAECYGIVKERVTLNS